MITPKQNQRANELRMQAEELRTDLHQLINELTGNNYDPADNQRRDMLYEAKEGAHECRSALHDFVDFTLLPQPPHEQA
jgi:hypothetical protein